MLTLNNILLLLTLLIALYTDLRWRKVYNGLTIPAMLLGLVWQLYSVGWAGSWIMLRVMLLVFLGLIILFSAGGLGGGDVKLLLAVGLLAAPADRLNIYAWSVICGGVLALLQLLWHRGQLKTVGRFLHGFFLSVFLRAPLPELEQKNIEQRKFPYSVAILAGFILSLFLKI